MEWERLGGDPVVARGGVARVRIAPDDPQAPDVRTVRAAHLAFAHASSPPEDVHALDVDGLLNASITFFSARDEHGRVAAVGALKELDERHGELKSMHTIAALRGSGIGTAMLRHLLAEADSGYERVSLETGTGAVFAPAHVLYTRAGFRECPPFGDYHSTRNSVCMTLLLKDAG